MAVDSSVVSFGKRATAARAIAKTIFDKTERQTLLDFLDECTVMAALKQPAVKPS